MLKTCLLDVNVLITMLTGGNPEAIAAAVHATDAVHLVTHTERQRSTTGAIVDWFAPVVQIGRSRLV